MKKILLTSVTLLVLGVLVYPVFSYLHQISINDKNAVDAAEINENITRKVSGVVTALLPAELPITDPAFIGPRGNVPDSAPMETGFDTFSIVVPGVLARSGQPTLAGFKWLKDNGWKSVVDLRIDGEYGEISDDRAIAGVADLGFKHLWLPIVDGWVPTTDQADQFLTFATDPTNQPLLVHCRAGVGRAGIMTALYRYRVQGWPMNKAIEESRLYYGGVNAVQEAWLKNWAETH